MTTFPRNDPHHPKEALGHVQVYRTPHTPHRTPPKNTVHGLSSGPTQERSDGSLVSDIVEDVSPAPTQVPASQREDDEGYGGVIAQLDEQTRVVECADSIQWILQRRSGVKWRNCSFCQSRAALLRNIREKRERWGEIDVTPLLSLPEWHP
jgi:hypothetical protein